MFGAHRVVATPLGLLRTEGAAASANPNRSEEKWTVVPAMFGHATRIIQVSDGLLWVQSSGQGVVALDDKFAMARLLPAIQGRCIAASTRGLWCLGYQGEYPPEAKFLTEYDGAGKFKRRWAADDLALVPAGPEPKPGEADGFGWGSFAGGGFGSGPSKIGWATVDEDAVWVSLNNYGYSPPLPTHPPTKQGTEAMGRLDRVTGRFTAIEIPAPRDKYGQLRVLSSREWVDLGDRIVWLTNYSDLDVWVLDKKSAQVSRALKIIAPHFDSIQIYNKMLWLSNRDDSEARSARIYSLDTFEKVAGRERFDIQQLPWSSDRRKPHFPDKESAPWAGILAASGNSAWLSGPGSNLLQANDQGEGRSFDAGYYVTRAVRRRIFAAATGESLLWARPGELQRVNFSDKHSTLPLAALGDRSKELGHRLFLAASPTRVWLQAEAGPMLEEAGPLLALSPDLLQSREVASPKLEGRDGATSATVAAIAVADTLYAWDAEGFLLRADAQTGQSTRVGSWSRRFPGDAPAPENAFPKTISPRREFAARRDAAFALPDGRLAFAFSETRDIRYSGGPERAWRRDEGQLDKARLLLFDPARDTWQEAEGPADVRPLAIGARIFGVDKERAYEWRGSRWQSIGPLPVAAREGSFGGGYEPDGQKATLAGTQRYLYRETPLGVFRIAWAAIAAR